MSSLPVTAMRWLYRLQARVGLSRPEGRATLALLLALLGGTVAHHFQAASAPVPADLYAASDAAFGEAAAQAAADTTSVAPRAFASLPPPERPSGEATAAPTDSSVAQVADAVVERAAAPRRSGKPPPAPTNINTASEAELQRLPRIGPALAGRIVAYRRANGPFRSVEQITEVRGIGEKTLEKMRPWIRL